MKEVVLLFNLTPYAPDPWARRGFTVHCYDFLTKETRTEITCTYWWKDWDEEKIFRSSTPRGFCEAVAEANA